MESVYNFNMIFPKVKVIDDAKDVKISPRKGHIK